jgi:hypothetical protein
LPAAGRGEQTTKTGSGALGGEMRATGQNVVHPVNSVVAAIAFEGSDTAW